MKFFRSPYGQDNTSDNEGFEYREENGCAESGLRMERISGDQNGGRNAENDEPTNLGTNESLGLEQFLRQNSHREILNRLDSMELGQPTSTWAKIWSKKPKLNSASDDINRVTPISEDDISVKSRSPTPGSYKIFGRSNSRTIFWSILRHATNGDKILRAKLDDCVSTTTEDENLAEYAIEVCTQPLTDSNGSQINILKDMLEFKDESIRNILTHPVVETFLDLKWRKISWIFYLNSLFYLIFLFFYSLFLGNIFYRNENKLAGIKITDLVIKDDKIFFPKEFSPDDLEGGIGVRPAFQFNGEGEEDPSKPWSKYGPGTNLTRAFTHCGLDNFYTPICAIELLLLISIFVLFFQELLQLFALGFINYFREFENSLEIIALSLALAGLVMQEKYYELKWISAFGICCSYFQLIFLFGRYPFLGGSISLMFYSILRHLFRSLSNFLVLIIGFAFGFFIINHGKEFDSFENPPKAFLKTLTMVLGEFEFDDLWEAHEDDMYSRAFAMVLLVGLAIAGSLILVNLIVALIVSDIEELRKAAHIQELVNKAQHIIQIETLAEYCCHFLRPRVRIANKVLICAHSVCGPSSCNASIFRIDPKIVENLRTLVRQKLVAKNLREFGAALNSTEGKESEDNKIINSAMKNLLKSMMLKKTAVNQKEDDGSSNNLLADLVGLMLQNK